MTRLIEVCSPRVPCAIRVHHPLVELQPVTVVLIVLNTVRMTRRPLKDISQRRQVGMLIPSLGLAIYARGEGQPRHIVGIGKIHTTDIHSIGVHPRNISTGKIDPGIIRTPAVGLIPVVHLSRLIESHVL